LNEILLALSVVFLVVGCANTPVEDHAKVIDGIELRFEDFPDSSIPAFVAKIRIKSSMGNLMLILMDFSSWPDWAYGCERIEVLQTVGFTEAYLYQVTSVPVIRNRDSILHAISTTSDGETVIDFESVPDFCLESETAACERSFSLNQISNEEVEVTWRQHQDPEGLVPEFLVRSNLSDIPLKSLTRLKALAEFP
jgi:hypothetical protein